jgi:hypothetical protein
VCAKDLLPSNTARPAEGGSRRRAAPARTARREQALDAARRVLGRAAAGERDEVSEEAVEGGLG